jgi:phage shock protein A
MAQTFNPVTELFTANINAMADWIDDPEQMVCQIIFDMEDTYTRALENKAESIDSEKNLEDEIRHAEDVIARWEHCVERCLKKNDKDMAIRALHQKKESEAKAEALRQTLKSRSDENRELRLEIIRMGKELEEIKQKALALGICHKIA